MTLGNSVYLTKNNRQTPYSYRAILVFCFLTFWLLFPILASLISLVFGIYYYGREKNHIPGFIFLLYAFSLGIIAYNATQGSSAECDLMRYRDTYDAFANSDINFLISSNLLFDFTNWTFARYIIPEPRFVGFLWVFLSSFILLITSRNLIEYYFERNRDLMVVCMYCTILFIPFVMIFELLKQCAAYSLILYAINLSITNRKGVKWIVLCSLLIHPTSVLLLWPLLFWKSKWVNRHLILILCLSLIIGGIGLLKLVSSLGNIPLFQLIGLSEKIKAYNGFDEWGGSIRYYFLSFFYALQVLFIYMCPKNNRPKGATITVLLLSVLLLNITENHNLARLINVLYPFNILAFILGIAAMKRANNRRIIISLCTLIFCTSNIIQYTSNVKNNYYLIYMDNSPSKIFGSNIFECFDIDQ